MTLRKNWRAEGTPREHLREENATRSGVPSAKERDRSLPEGQGQDGKNEIKLEQDGSQMGQRKKAGGRHTVGEARHGSRAGRAKSVDSGPNSSSAPTCCVTLGKPLALSVSPSLMRVQ